MEKRRGKRHKKRLMVKFSVEGVEHTAFIEDISSTGIRIKTNYVFKPGSNIKMEIINEVSGNVMQVEGLVMWARKVPPSMMHKTRCGMGIAYLKFDSNMHDFLINLTTGNSGSG